jgi:hypothetical protein
VGQADAILTSPPYADQVIRARTSVRPISFDKNAYCWGTIAGGAHAFDAYGTAEGQVGALKSGPCPGGEAGVDDVETLTWAGIYSQGWGRTLLSPGAFAHPAKFAYGLLTRLYDHGFERGWWHKGDIATVTPEIQAQIIRELAEMGLDVANPHE